MKIVITSNTWFGSMGEYLAYYQSCKNSQTSEESFQFIVWLNCNYKKAAERPSSNSELLLLSSLHSCCDPSSSQLGTTKT